jgi:tetratricopeptide (TPR) repeat protein
VIPAFELPVMEPGYHAPRELRVRGKALLGSEIKVRGYVTALYDCSEALAASNPKVNRDQIAAAIRDDPSLCDRTMFWLGDAHDTPRETSIAVVAPPPDPRRARALPRVSVGDYAVITGTWGGDAQAADRTTDPVLRFASAERWTPPSVAPEQAAPSKDLEIDLEITGNAPMRTFVDDVTLNASLAHLNACNKALAARQYDDGIAECREATTVWVGNHLAWYAWASAHIARREWIKARSAIEHAVALRPDQAMYQLYHGISLYEIEREAARDAQARREHKKPEEVELDPTAMKLAPARDALVAAVRAGPDLWRAHYYLGRVYRDLDEPRHAAVQFSQAIKTNPAYRFPYVALIELYRRWDYVDQALAVAMLGTTYVAATEAGELWFEIGMAYDAKRADDKALYAFSRAIAGRPDDGDSKFQRGQIYLRRGDLAGARRDLEDVARAPDGKLGVVKQLANQMLGQISRAGGPTRQPFWDCRRRSTGTSIVCRQR